MRWNESSGAIKRVFFDSLPAFLRFCSPHIVVHAARLMLRNGRSTSLESLEHVPFRIQGDDQPHDKKQWPVRMSAALSHRVMSPPGDFIR